MFHTIALVLLTMVGYSSGVVLTARRRAWEPILFDLLAVDALWVLVFSLRDGFGRWQMIGIAVLLGMITSTIITTIRFASEKSTALPDSEIPEHAREQAAAESLSLPSRALKAWQRFGGEMGSAQGRMIMGFFYFIILTPFALYAKLSSDPLDLNMNASWVAREQEPATLENASEQG